MRDRRREGRATPVTPLVAHDADSLAELGLVTDISGHGLLLSSSAPLTLHRSYHLRIRAPGADAPALEVTAEAAWSVRVLNPVSHRTGFRNLAAAPGQEALLNRLIDACYADSSS